MEKKHGDLLNAIAEAQNKFILSEDAHTIFNYLLDILLELTNSEYGFIGQTFYKDKKPYLKTHAITDISWDEATNKFYRDNAPQGLEFFNLNTLFGQVMVTGKPVIANDPYNDPRRGGLPEGHPHMGCFLGIPFFTKDKLNGMVGIANRPGGYKQDLIEFLAPFLTTCSTLIEGFRNLKLKEDAEKKLKHNYQKIINLNNELEQYAYVISHDLKTPIIGINTISAWIEEDLEDNIPEELKANLELLKSRVGRLNKLIDSMLIYSKIGKNIKQEDKSEVSLNKLLKQIIQDLEITENIKIEIDDNLPVLYLDEQMLYTVFYNLLENCLVHNDKTSLKIEVSGDLENDVFHFSIKDNGKKIPENKKEKIFKLFQTLETKDKTNTVGAGLSIARKYIEFFNGSIYLDSSVPDRNNFCINIPLKSSNI